MSFVLNILHKVFYNPTIKKYRINPLRNIDTKLYTHSVLNQLKNSNIHYVIIMLKEWYI